MKGPQIRKFSKEDKMPVQVMKADKVLMDAALNAKFMSKVKLGLVWLDK